jgi:hypothetical protein
VENVVYEDVDKGIELSILFRMALTKYSGTVASAAQHSRYIIIQRGGRPAY